MNINNAERNYTFDAFALGDGGGDDANEADTAKVVVASGTGRFGTGGGVGGALGGGDAGSGGDVDRFAPPRAWAGCAPPNPSCA